MLSTIGSQDTLYAYLVGIGMTEASVNDMLYEFFTGLGYSGSVVDMEFAYLADFGYTTGALPDRWYAMLLDKGYTGALPDMFYAAILVDDVFSTGSVFVPLGSDALITSDGKTFYTA